ncbi:MAG: hypothetical protein JNK58_13140 [Phycisphaerae bacterium]|nr:hypothetical protein [Phycisphaerae bacterium]
MGSNNWLRAVSAVGLAVATLGPIPAANADYLDGVKGHIDIPEIARTRKSIPNVADHFAGIVDEFGSSDVFDPIMVDPDLRLPGSIGSGPSVPDELTATYSRLIVTAPESGATAIGIGETVRGVPGPASAAPLMVLAFGFGRRRRA